MPEGYLGIDVSHFTAPVSAGQLEAIKAMGYRFVIVGLQMEDRFVQHLRVAYAAGMRTEAYIYLYAKHPANPSVSAEDQVRWSIGKIQEHNLPVKRLWLDVEDGFEEGASADNLTRLKECIFTARELAPTLPLGIYTRRDYWQGHMANSPMVGDMRLWDASYNTDAHGAWHPEWPIDFSLFRPYGGWLKPHTRQFRGTYNLRGINCDLNYREAAEDEEAAEAAEEPEEEGDMGLTEADVVRILTKTLGSNAGYKALKQAPMDLFRSGLPGSDAVVGDYEISDPGKPITLDLYMHLLRDRIRELQERNAAGTVALNELARKVEELAARPASIVHNHDTGPGKPI